MALQGTLPGGWRRDHAVTGGGGVLAIEADGPFSMRAVAVRKKDSLGSIPKISLRLGGQSMQKNRFLDGSRDLLKNRFVPFD